MRKAVKWVGVVSLRPATLRLWPSRYPTRNLSATSNISIASDTLIPRPRSNSYIFYTFTSDVPGTKVESRRSTGEGALPASLGLVLSLRGPRSLRIRRTEQIGVAREPVIADNVSNYRYG